MQCTSIFRAGAILLGFALAACQPDSDAPETATETSESASPSASAPVGDGSEADGDSSSEEIAHTLVPLPGMEDVVPQLTRSTTVLLETTAGDVTIEVYPEAAPNAAQRFIELVESGFYDDTPISRVVPDFVAQFGVNWRAPHSTWQTRMFNDDPTLFSLERGTLAFAKAGPNSNSTQVFINYSENNRLAEDNFTVFAEVVSGMDVVDSFAQVGDPSGGLNQTRLWADGGNYLDSLDEKPTMIERAVVR